MPTFFFFLSTSFSFQLFCFYSILFGTQCPEIFEFSKFFSRIAESLENTRIHHVRSIERIENLERSEQLERGASPRPKQKKRASVRFLVSSLLEDATVCPTVCTTCSTRCDWATRANLPSSAYAVIVEDGSARTTSSRRFLRPVCLG